MGIWRISYLVREQKLGRWSSLSLTLLCWELRVLRAGRKRKPGRREHEGGYFKLGASPSRCQDRVLLSISLSFGSPSTHDLNHQLGGIQIVVQSTSSLITYLLPLLLLLLLTRCLFQDQSPSISYLITTLVYSPICHSNDSEAISWGVPKARITQSGQAQ